MQYLTLNLDELRVQANLPKAPFPHQLDAFAALNKVFTFKDKQPKSGLLVLPTGAGKTFTAVRWLCDNVFIRNYKVLWLAQSFYLLDQACLAFQEDAAKIGEPRKTLNIRTVSSNPSHANAFSIQPTDDVVIMTTQTAIKNLHSDAVDGSGKTVITNFRKYIDSCRETGLLVVLDEAHHAPAYGCRNLLVGNKPEAPGIKELIPNLYLLGLTATPTYNDVTRRGWLLKIFEQGILYEAKKNTLMAQDILARPTFIEKATGKEIEVDDKTYFQLVRDHKDVPEHIIEKLASDAGRNDYIVNEYIQHQAKYGKTIIFADRWFQCVYLKTKLMEQGIKADAVYSHIDADPGSPEARNQRTVLENEKILHDFKNDKEKLDVLINVRMLTEGVDVPSVQTVFLTRQTTSPILFTQMVGRALRGKKAGGSSEANIVLFMDDWKRLIDWATPLSGGIEEGGKSTVKGFYPLEYISIRLIEELSKQINSGLGGINSPPLSQFMPVGWFQTELVIALEQSEETQSFIEFVMVYDFNKAKYLVFIEVIAKTLSDEWAKETLLPEWMQPQVEEWIDTHFDREVDDIGNSLALDLIKIARHIAQNQALPNYFPFEEREKHDIDKLAEKLLNNNPLEKTQLLAHEFSQSGRLWKTFYKSLPTFIAAVDGAISRLAFMQVYGTTSISVVAPSQGVSKYRELTTAEKKQLKERDQKCCLACGAIRRLQIDHIIPFSMGGETSVDNSQTLCGDCNKEKDINEINFRLHVTQLPSPKTLKLLPLYKNDLSAEQALTRLTNFFYHCKACHRIAVHQRSNGQFYAKWRIELYAGNNPNWLLQHKAAIVKHIQEVYGFPHVTDIEVVAPGTN